MQPRRKDVKLSYLMYSFWNRGSKLSHTHVHACICFLVVQVEESLGGEHCHGSSAHSSPSGETAWSWCPWGKQPLQHCWDQSSGLLCLWADTPLSSLLSTKRFKAWQWAPMKTGQATNSWWKPFFFTPSSSHSKSISPLLGGLDTNMHVCNAFCCGLNESFVSPLSTSSKLHKKPRKHYFNSVMTV